MCFTCLDRQGARCHYPPEGVGLSAFNWLADTHEMLPTFLNTLPTPSPTNSTFEMFLSHQRPEPVPVVGGVEIAQHTRGANSGSTHGVLCSLLGAGLCCHGFGPFGAAIRQRDSLCITGTLFYLGKLLLKSNTLCSHLPIFLVMPPPFVIFPQILLLTTEKLSLPN